MTSLTESVVEEAALSWYGELGYAVAHRPDLVPVNPRLSVSRSVM